MSDYSIKITKPAENDLRGIGDYIAQQLLEPEIASKVVNKIGNAIMTLEENPLRNSLVADQRLSLQCIRKIIVENFIVFYIVKEELRIVTIIRILYDRRDWMTLL